MRTSKPISTISYNSEEFLKHQLCELIKSHKISDYMYIWHEPENDEKKGHFHLWIKPNTLIDTMDLQEFFTELDPNNVKPRKCIDFILGKVDDWILYCQHFGPYLASKGEMREFFYTREDFRYYDEDTFESLYNHAFKGSDWAKRYQILQALNSGSVAPQDLIMNGTVPLNLASQLSALEYMKNHYGTTVRGNHKNHEEGENESKNE